MLGMDIWFGWSKCWQIQRESFISGAHHQQTEWQVDINLKSTTETFNARPSLQVDPEVSQEFSVVQCLSASHSKHEIGF